MEKKRAYWYAIRLFHHLYLINRTMLKTFLALLLFSVTVHISYASDTTSLQVHFKFNAYELTSDARLKLNDVLPEDSSITLTNIKIYGYCDQIGSHAYNQQLSIKRANEAKKYLISKGVSADIITVIEGKGKSVLVTDKMDEISRQQNRRVLVMIEYNAKVVEETVIIKSSKAKKDTTSTVEKKPTTLIDKIKDTATKAGDKITLQNIHFMGGRHVLLTESYATLAELLGTMQAIPSLVIEIQGHICCTDFADDATDMDLGTNDLSVQRAKSVFLYLLRNGIDENRMSYKGFGHKFPLTQERNDVEKAMNRRVEIKIISK